MATSPNATQITPPRVALIDERTGAVSREWYRWFYSLYNIVGGGLGVIPVASGGTGLSTIPTNGQLLIGNGAGYSLNTLGTGAGISVVNDVGIITIANTGVLSFSSGTTGFTPITTATGVVTLAGTLIAANGGTGFATYAVGDLLYADTSTTLDKLPDVVIGNALISGGVGAAPAWGKVGLTTHVSGTLPIANGGTNGFATPTAYGVAYGTGTAYAFTAAGTAKQALLANTGSAPTWSTLTSGASILYGDGSGGFSNVTIGTGVSFVGGTLSATGTGGTVTSVSGTAGRITSTGGTTPVIDLASGVATAGTTGSSTLIPVVTIDTYGRVTGITTAANPQGTVTSVTGTSPVVSSGGATPAISMPAATTSVSGYLTSTDWNTFNGKGSGSVTSVSVVSANGFAGTVATATTTPAITLTTSVTGVLKGNGTAISAAVVNTDYFAPSAPVTKTADFTVAATEVWLINNKSGSTCTVTLPAASSWTGRVLRFQNYQVRAVVSASSNVVPLAGGAAGTSILLASSGDSATLVSDGSNWLMTQYIPNNILLLE